jgi:hypothetical protein
MPIPKSKNLQETYADISRRRPTLGSGVRFGVHNGPLDSQILAVLTVRKRGEGRNRTDAYSFCRAAPYHLATPPF